MHKVAVITGSGRGIGRGIAKALAMDGFTIVVHYANNAGTAQQVVDEITANGGAAFSLKADLASLPEIRHFFNSLDNELTKRTGARDIDVLVNNAGISSPASYKEITPEQFDHLFAVNTRAPFFVIQFAIPRLRDGGRIVNISSLASRRASPSPMTPPYSMTKAALDALTLGVAQDLGQRRITVNTIAPGAILTDMNARFLNDLEVRKGIEAQTALRRIGKVEDIGNIVRFLASADSQWITGSTSKPEADSNFES